MKKGIKKVYGLYNCSSLLLNGRQTQDSAIRHWQIKGTALDEDIPMGAVLLLQGEPKSLDDDGYVIRVFEHV